MVAEATTSLSLDPFADMPAPLLGLIPVFIDVETFVSTEVTLGKMTLRQYLAASYLQTMSIAVGFDETPMVFYTKEYPGPSGCNYVDDTLINVLRTLAKDPKYVFVAHNAAFDMRVIRIYLGVPHPINVWCTLEGSMGTWPEFPGGYRLENLTTQLLPAEFRKYHVPLKEVESLRHKCIKFGDQKADTMSDELLEVVDRICRDNGIERDVATISGEFLSRVIALYNIRDVVGMRELYRRQTTRLHAREQGVALRTHRQRGLTFNVDQHRLAELTDVLEQAMLKAQHEAGEYLTDEQVDLVFNIENGATRSVRAKKLRAVINSGIAEDQFESTSLKKISPLLLARNPKAAAILTQTSRVNKMLSHRRRSGIFDGVEEVDVELGYARATTFRFSSPSTGRGLNLHNCPKHDKDIARPVRRLFRLPPHLCAVRADLANVECRVESLLTGARRGIAMFDPTKGGDLFADPYIMTWLAMTGTLIKNKKDPIRQVAKSAVLGLGFCMSPTGYCRVLLTTLADKKSGVTEDTLKQLIISNRWKLPQDDGVAHVMRNLGCSQIVALAAYHVHRVFNETFPEYAITAGWIVNVASAIASCPVGQVGLASAKRIIELAYSPDRSGRPDRNLINIEPFLDDFGEYVSLRVGCGYWPHTLVWREPRNRMTDFSNRGKALTIKKASGEIKPFTRQLAIENITQAAARNAMCMGVERLDTLGFPHVIHVHDEALIICERKRETVLAAKQALTTAFGPGHGMPWDWSILVKPEEITVTESIYEDEDDIAKVLKKRQDDGSYIDVPGPDRWGRIERNTDDCLIALP